MDNLYRFPGGQNAARSRETSTDHVGLHDKKRNFGTQDAHHDALPVNELPKHLPRHNGKKVHIPTIWRWINRGVRGVKLESLTIGGRRYVTRQSLDQFLEAINRPRITRPELQPPAQLHRQAEQAAREAQQILGGSTSKEVA